MNNIRPILPYLVLGFLFFAILSMSYLISTIFFAVFCLLIFLYHKDATKNKKILICSLFILYLLILFIPFSESSSGLFGITEKRCTCLGLEKGDIFVGFTGGYSVQCIGVPTNCRCYRWYQGVGKTEVSC